MLSLVLTYFIKCWLKKSIFILFNIEIYLYLFNSSIDEVLETRGLHAVAFILMCYFYFEEKNMVLMFLNFFETSQDLNQQKQISTLSFLILY